MEVNDLKAENVLTAKYTLSRAANGNTSFMDSSLLSIRMTARALGADANTNKTQKTDKLNF